VFICQPEPNGSAGPRSNPDLRRQQ
jgi:hypothetical protein